MTGVPPPQSCPSIPYQARHFADELAEGDAEGNPCGLGIDIDEAAHAGFALTKNGGIGALRDHAQHQMNLATNHHLIGAMAFEPLVKGGAGLCSTLAASALVAPAASFAMHAGWHEWREAATQISKFADRERHLACEGALTSKLSPENRQNLASLTAAFDDAAAGRLAENARLAEASRVGGLIGKYSFLSGAAIMARIGLELLRNVGGAAATGTTHVASAASAGMLSPSFLTGTGLASNGLASLASGFAVMLGVNFVRKTRAARATWKADLPSMLVRPTMLANPDSAYGRFLEAKGKHRMQFLNRFHIKNRMFLAGASLYAAGTCLPACIKMLAAAGILSSKKIGSKLILALFTTGIAGAIVMGLFSHQFFYGHPNLERYEQYALKDNKELDRRFLTKIDTFTFTDEQGRTLGESYAMKQGLAMREAAFDCVRKVESIRNALLVDIAHQRKRAHARISHVGDVDYEAHRPFRTKVTMLLRRDHLRLSDVEQWIDTSSHHVRLRDYFQSIIATKTTFLERKEALHRRMQQHIMEGAHGLADVQERQNYATAMFGSYDDTAALLEEYRNVASLIVEASTPEATEVALRKALKLQTGTEEKPEKSKLSAQLAKHVFETMSARHNHDRGMLLDIERQAGKPHSTIIRPLAMR